MHIVGFQKLTLLDFPGHTACTLFTKGCNLRCPFCHNALLVTGEEETEEYTEEEIFAFLKKRQGVLDGVAITGGEPLLQPDIRSFIERIRALGYAVKLDTNGFYPEKLSELVHAGLVDYVAVDIKNTKEKYPETVGLSAISLEPLERTVAFLQENRVPYEFRTTVVEEFHTEEDMRAIAAWISGCPRYFLQNFVDSGHLIGEGLHEVGKAKMRRFLEVVREQIPGASVRGTDI